MENTDPGGRLSEAELRHMVGLLARFASHDLDQWENWQLKTPGGPVYVIMANALMAGWTEEAFAKIWPLSTNLTEGGKADTDLTLSVPGYDPVRGVVAPTEGGTIVVDIVGGSVEIFGDAAGLRDLARWCLALSDQQAGPGSHVHLDPGTDPLDTASAPLLLARRGD